MANGVIIKDNNITDVSITKQNSSDIVGRRSGNVITLTINSSGSIAPQTWTYIGKIDNTWDIPRDLIGAVIPSSSVNTFALVEVTTSGNIKIYSYLNDGSMRSFEHLTITYIV